MEIVNNKPNHSETMKKVIILVGVLTALLASVSMAQTTTGAINYEVKTNMHRRIPKEREAMKSMIPEFRTENNQLFFINGESVYKPLEDEEEDVNAQSGGTRIVMRMPKSEIYLNSSSMARLVQQEFNGKKYLIKDTLQVAPWKLGSATKEIMGYQCQQAYYTDTVRNQEITAWYTLQLPAFLGPESFNTLPGTVLAVDINNAERVIVARKIDLRELKKNEFKIPDKGTEITRKDFQTMVDQEMERMRANGGGGMIIRN